jgi:hypothetical protein
MKKALIIIGVCFLAAVLLAVMYFGYFFAVVQPGLDKESRAWIDDVVPRIVATWDVNEAFNDSSSNLLQITSRDELKSLFAALSSKLGAFKKYDGATGEAGIEINNGHESTTAEYLARAEFSNGAAEMHIRGIKEYGHWKILEFHVDVGATPNPSMATTTINQSGHY